MSSISKSAYRLGFAAFFAATLTSIVNAQEFTAGHLFVSSGFGRVHELDAKGKNVRTIGIGTGLTAARGLAFGPNGHLFVASFDTDAIFVYDGSGAKVKTLTPPGLDGPYALAFGPNGHLYVTSFENDHVLELTDGGALVKDIQPQAFDQPSGILVSPEGNLYVTGAASDNVVELDPQGEFVRIVKAGIDNCQGIVWAGGGALFVGGFDAGAQVYKLSLTTAPGNHAATGTGSNVTSLTVGPDGRVYGVTSTIVGGKKLFATDPATLESVLASDAGDSFELLWGVAFAPQRFQGKLTGKLERPGAQAKNVNEACVVSMSPCGSWVMIQLNDDAANLEDLTTTFTSDALVFQGRVTPGPKPEKQRFGGAQAGRKVLADGMASTVLTLHLTATDVGALSLKKITGTVYRDSWQAAFAGKLTTSKKLN